MSPPWYSWLGVQVEIVSCSDAVLVGDGFREGEFLLALSSVDGRKRYFVFLEVLFLFLEMLSLMPLVTRPFYVPYLNNRSTPFLDLQV